MAIVFIGINLLLFLIPKPYPNQFGDDCHSYPNGGYESGWCIGIIYPTNQEVRGEPEPDAIAYAKGLDYCVESKNG